MMAKHLIPVLFFIIQLVPCQGQSNHHFNEFNDISTKIIATIDSITLNVGQEIDLVILPFLNKDAKKSYFADYINDVLLNIFISSNTNFFFISNNWHRENLTEEEIKKLNFRMPSSGVLGKIQRESPIDYIITGKWEPLDTNDLSSQVRFTIKLISVLEKDIILADTFTLTAESFLNEILLSTIRPKNSFTKTHLFSISTFADAFGFIDDNPNQLASLAFDYRYNFFKKTTIKIGFALPRVGIKDRDLTLGGIDRIIGNQLVTTRFTTIGDLYAYKNLITEVGVFQTFQIDTKNKIEFGLSAIYGSTQIRDPVFVTIGEIDPFISLTTVEDINMPFLGGSPYLGFETQISKSIIHASVAYNYIQPTKELSRTGGSISIDTFRDDSFTSRSNGLFVGNISTLLYQKGTYFFSVKVGFVSNTTFSQYIPHLKIGVTGNIRDCCKK